MPARSRTACLTPPGIQPCTELETRAGIWRYDANRTGQRFSPAERFVTGLRNGEGIAFDSAGRMFATSTAATSCARTGRSSIRRSRAPTSRPRSWCSWSEAPTMAGRIATSTSSQHKLVLAPEYGGDGGKAVGACAPTSELPSRRFPGTGRRTISRLYDGQQFPAAYRGGAFIAFHGSWNRAPFPQGGYNVVFQPLADGKASRQYVVFADGFAGAVKEPGQAAHRPSGLAVGSDGVRSTFRTTSAGGSGARHLSRSRLGGSCSRTRAITPDPTPRRQEPLFRRRGFIRMPALRRWPLPTPPGATAEEVALGSRVYDGQVASAPCAGCHGTDGKGSPRGPT